MIGITRELRAVWPRLLAGRLVPILFGASLLLIVGARAVAPVPAGAIHTELARLQTANEIIGFALMILAFLSAYLLLAPDLHDEFESMRASSGSRPLTFAAGRVLIGTSALLLMTAVLGLTVEATDLGGRYQREEAVHLVVLLANAVPVFMLALVLTAIFGRVVSLVVTFVLMSVGSDAAYQRAALADHFIDPSGPFSAEQAIAWVAPRPLMDPLPGVAVMDQSVALQQFPVREGHAVWGMDLIRVSGTADIAQYLIYLVALAAALYIVCRFRAAHARTRFHLVPAWLEARRPDDTQA
ncbi:MAG: hypothetical protein M3082_03215 [Candidatus Dormibacteraeota bacterium]|nr:hypothetical protein [Candidatus Dormibacteraeota bacterium]